ncbi:hypothetical protein BGZ73_002610 [Actinomortierella ambigua]|nr:hypothetical protein BGZ73_002610 [Actinomortierella ambigua]
MSDQAELLRKRREARQKRILASGESRLNKITSTSGAGAQSMPTTPTPSVALARDQLLKKEQEEKEARRRLSNASTTSQVAAGVAASLGSNATTEAVGGEDNSNADDVAATTLPTVNEVSDSTLQGNNQDKAETIAPRRSRQSSVASLGGSVKTMGSPASLKPPVTVVDYDADPDDSLGAPDPALASTSSSANTSSPFQPFPAAGSSTFRRRPSNLDAASSDPFRSLTRTLSSQGSDYGGLHSRSATAGSMPGSGGFTVITPQEDPSVRWWKLLHLVLSTLFGLGLIYQEYKREATWARFDMLAVEKPTAGGFFQVTQVPAFWYFVTMELLLQSTRMFVHGVAASPSSTLGTIAGMLPPPFSDAIHIFSRYRLIWSSFVNDLAVVVFIVGMTIAVTHMFS